MRRFQLKTSFITINFHFSMFQIKELNHDNVNKFYGFSSHDKTVLTLWTYCSKGSVYDLLVDCEIKLDSSFFFSFAQDIAQVGNEQAIVNYNYCSYYVIL